MSAAPEMSAPYLAADTSGVLRGLLLVGLATLCFAASVAGGARYGWELAHASSDDLDSLFGGWQVTVAKVLIGVVVLAVTVAAGYWTLRQSRSLSDRTPHTRAVVMAMLLPGVLVGSQLAGPINSTLTWASNHTSQASTSGAQFRQFLSNERKAPLQVGSQFPVAAPALANRLLTSAALGAGWYSTSRPATRAAQISSSLARQGALRGGSTFLTQARRGATGFWIINLSVIQHVTTFSDTGQARRYAATYRHQSAQPCHCGAPEITETITQVRRRTIKGVGVQQWLATDGVNLDREAVFRRGHAVFSLLASTGTAGKSVTTRAFMTLVRQAVASSNPGG